MAARRQIMPRRQSTPPRDELETPRGTPGGPVYDPDSFARFAERLARFLGTGRYLAAQTIVVFLWILLNGVGFIRHWDPYPFIFLNLVLSFQGAFAAPIILMSQNRQETRDRLEEQRDHEINLRAEREVAAMQARIETLGRDSLQAISALREEQRDIADRLNAILATMEQARVLEAERFTTKHEARSAPDK